jgi:hypothetical protein
VLEFIKPEDPLGFGQDALGRQKPDKGRGKHGGKPEQKSDGFFQFAPYIRDIQVSEISIKIYPNMPIPRHLGEIPVFPVKNPAAAETGLPDLPPWDAMIMTSCRPLSREFILLLKRLGNPGFF